MTKALAVRTHEEMKPVLMNPEAPGPEIYYYMIRGGVDKKNITVWGTGTVGGEYIKTYGHYHVGQLSETYWVISGEGIVLLQTRKKDALGNFLDDEIESFQALRVKPGDKIFMDKEVGHLLVNVGNTWLVTVDNSPVNFEEKDPVGLPGHADYEPIKKLHGFAYYVVVENGQSKLIRNPHYTSVPEAKICRKNLLFG